MFYRRSQDRRFPHAAASSLSTGPNNQIPAGPAAQRGVGKWEAPLGAWGSSPWGWARLVCTELQADGGATLGMWVPAEQHPQALSRKGYGAHRQPSQAQSSKVGAQGTGPGEEGQRMKHRADPCTTPTPHLVDKLPEVLLPQVVHHVLGKKKAVRHSPAQHTTISPQKGGGRVRTQTFKHLWALLAALPSQRAQTPQQRTQLPKVPSQGGPTLRAQMCQGLGHRNHCATTNCDTSVI